MPPQKSDTSRSRSAPRGAFPGRYPLICRLFFIGIAIPAIALTSVLGQSGSQRALEAVGEPQTFAPLQGFTMTLGTGSHALLQETQNSVLVRVLNGDASFTMTPALAHSVVVNAGNAQIEALDGNFCVCLRADKTTIVVLAGAARLTPTVTSSKQQPMSVPLRAGDRVQLSRNHTSLVFRFGGPTSAPSCRVGGIK